MRKYFIPLFISSSIFFWMGCSTGQSPSDPSANPEPLPDSTEAGRYIKNGDLVLRSDDDIVGISLRNLNDSDKSYSHSGIAFLEDSAWVVYHMMAGEENPSLEMRRDPLSLYIDRQQKSGYGIFRYQLSPSEADSLHLLVQEQYRNKLKFDTAFDLKDDHSMYCSEMIGKDLAQITGGRIKVRTTKKSHFSFKARSASPPPGRDVEYIAIDNLYLDDWCTVVFRKQYK